MQQINLIRHKLIRLLRCFEDPFKIKVDFRSKRYRKREECIPNYRIPDILLNGENNLISDLHTWSSIRRSELLQIFRQHMFGKSPFHLIKTNYSIFSEDENALNGRAYRKEVDIYREDKREAFFRVIIYYPKKTIYTSNKIPIFVGLNFYGNQTISKEKGISATESWVPDDSVTLGRGARSLRGVQSSSWPLKLILENGYALASAYYGDILPDKKNGKKLALHKWFNEHEMKDIELENWGAIDAWAWGLSRALDYIKNDEYLDSSKVIVIGHSRLGKVALWAGAQDERFAMVISNNSGCCGASLFRRKIGETISMINHYNPHWFCEKFKEYNDREDKLPFDQHHLIALIAPRPVYISSAQLDLEADPYGEFLAAKYATPIYHLYGLPGLPTETLPAINVPIMGTIGYHIRKGRHGIKKFDWKQFIKFANLHFQK
jgi:hypothetical protein